METLPQQPMSMNCFVIGTYIIHVYVQKKV